MNNINNQSPSGQANITSSDNIVEGMQLDIKAVWLLLKRRKSVIIKSTIITLLAALLFIFIQTPLYTAESVLQFRLRNNEVVDVKSVMSGLSSDSAALESEIDVIRSRILLGRVADKLQLRNEDEFQDVISGKSILSSIKNFFISPSKESEEESKQIEQNLIIGKLLKNLEVSRRSRSYTVWIKYTAQDPKLAKKVANNIIDEYLVDQLNTRFEATKRANQWLNDRVVVLRKKVKESEHVVQKFKEKHDIVNISGESGRNNQLTELNSQLIIARSDQAQSHARLAQVQDIINSKDDINTIAEVLNSELINNLRVQESELLMKQSEYKTRYKSLHPLMIKTKNEISDLKSNIEKEVKKIIKGMKYEVEVAKTKEKSLEKSLVILRKKLNMANRFEMQLSELVREMTANRALYDAFLVRFKETSEDQSFYQSDARIISRAQTPMVPSWPKKKIIFALALLFGVGLGITIVFVIEYFDDAFRSASQVENTLGISSIGMVVELDEEDSPIDYVVKKVTSAYAESLRSVNTAIHFSNPDNPPKSIVVTSSVPKEGKSVFSASLASLMAKSGLKVLLVDCDMRLPTVHKSFESDLEKGLGDLLMGEAVIEEIVGVDKKSGLHYIRSFPNTPHSQELLGSHKMEEFMKLASDEYDMIILDAPPIMALSDAIVLSHVADTTILLSRWEKTPRNVVKEAVKRLTAGKVNIAGVVLSRVDMDKQSTYEYGDAGYYYGKYKDYYTS